MFPLLVALLMGIAVVAPAQESAAAEPSYSGATPLSKLISRDWDRAWPAGESEVATYRMDRLVNGISVQQTVTIIVQPATLNREFYTPATWPYGQKPLVETLRMTLAVEAASADNAPAPRHETAILHFPRQPFGRVLRMNIGILEPGCITAKDFQLWGDRRRLVYQTCVDGIGSGARELPPQIDDLYEEELPLALRALDFRDGQTGSFWLYDGQMNRDAREPKASPALLRVSDSGNNSWIVDVSCRDTREMRLEFSGEGMKVLKSWTHSDGRRLTLQDVRRSSATPDSGGGG